VTLADGPGEMRQKSEQEKKPMSFAQGRPNILQVVPIRAFGKSCASC
jgi:hypothetical protein